MAMKAKHAFGSEQNISKALADGKIDAYDILFLDEKKVGWVTKDGEVVIAETDLSGIEAELATKASSEDVQAIEEELANKASSEDVQAIEEELANKITADEVDTKIEEKVVTVVEEKITEIKTGYEIVEF